MQLQIPRGQWFQFPEGVAMTAYPQPSRWPDKLRIDFDGETFRCNECGNRSQIANAIRRSMHPLSPIICAECNAISKGVQHGQS